jgi:hypothetical protein
MTDTLIKAGDDVAASRPDPPARSRWRRVGFVAIGAWLAAFGFQIAYFGVPLDREAVMGWIALGIGALSIGRRSLWTVLVDWLPFALVLIAYDFARGVSSTISGYAVWTPQLTVEKWFFGGIEPTVWLQSHLKYSHPAWWEAIISVCYASFFLLPYVVAGVLWLRSRTEFRRWAGRFVALSFIGVVVFVFMPAAPPWAAALCTKAEVASLPADPPCIYRDPKLSPPDNVLGVVTPVHPPAAPYVERLSARGWEVLHLNTAKELLNKGQAIVDPVAAVPSLHGGVTLLLVLFLWRRVRRRWWPLLAIYPVLMTFSLVYTGEHYVVDILVGWALAVAVTVAAGRIERRIMRARHPDTLADDSPGADLEATCPPTATTPSST